ncbi:MAG TPA: FMN-binding negative transcriptional regulator [Amycolatopsis sp.]|jgi:transcriptional regulator|nr:FMN-binding negative transcriptional regulator [Amycolatopsis sp.]
MLEQALYRQQDLDRVRALVDEDGWVTLVSFVPDDGLVVSHLPIILDPARADATVLGHLARKDAEAHELGTREVVIIVAGPDGYVSPSFYQDGPYVPTWNFQVLHLHGRPALLPAEETYDVLERTVDHFEARRPVPWQLPSVAGYARKIAPHTTGFRLTPRRLVGKAKLSQEKPRETALRVITALENEADVHYNPSLAAAMRHTLLVDGRPSASSHTDALARRGENRTA